MPEPEPEPVEGEPIEAADTAESRPITWPITYAHAEAAQVAAEGNH